MDGNVFGRGRIARDGTTALQARGLDFELSLATDVSTRISWLGFSAEAIFQPFDSDPTGLLRTGDETENGRLLDDASPWSLSLVLVLPIATR